MFNIYLCLPSLWKEDQATSLNKPRLTRMFQGENKLNENFAHL